MKRKLFLVFLVAVLFACENKKEKQQVVDETCDTTNVTYSNSIAGIITSNGCPACHSGASAVAPFTLDSYAQVKAKASETRNGNSVLYGALAHLSGFVPMPQGGGQISPCDLAKIKAWINAGTPE